MFRNIFNFFHVSSSDSLQNFKTEAQTSNYKKRIRLEDGFFFNSKPTRKKCWQDTFEHLEQTEEKSQKKFVTEPAENLRALEIMYSYNISKLTFTLA